MGPVPLDTEAIEMIAEIESQQRALETAKNVLAVYLRKREGLDESWQLAASRREFVQQNGSKEAVSRQLPKADS